MNKLALFGLVVIITSCQKIKEKMHKDIPCATVNSETVPQTVKDSFTRQYPGTNVNTWFNKDNNGYSALFTQNGTLIIAQFNNDGVLIKEGAESNQNGDHQDNNDDKGCSCEVEDKD